MGLSHDENSVTVRASWLEQGERYLIVGYRNDSGEVSLGLCSPSGKLSRASDDDLHHLRGFAKLEPFATLHGFVLNEGNWSRLGNVRVTARSGERQVFAETDDNGYFEFKRLPLGRYEVTAEKRGYVVRWPGTGTWQVNLARGACSKLNFDLRKRVDYDLF